MAGQDAARLRQGVPLHRFRASTCEAADVIVLGGGPAGAAAARLLGLCGRRVVLLPGAAPRRAGSAESLPPSCRKPLLMLDAVDAIAGAGFLRTTGNTTLWGNAAPRVERFAAGEVGLQAERRAFDSLLLRLAADAGATIVSGARAVSVRLAGESGECAIVDWSTDGERGQIEAPWVLDASGRSGIIARRGLRVRDAAPATTALIGVWRRDGGWPGVDPTHTIVESYRDGWFWSVPVADGRRWVAAMVDPQATSLTRGSGIAALYHGEIAKTNLMRQLLESARTMGQPWACPATPYGARRFTGAGFLLVGDAGAFIDPLSSAGVKKALASGCLAAVVVNTCLADATRQAAALALFDEHERAAHVGHARRAAAFYAAALDAHPHPFWRARAAAQPRGAGSDAADPRLDARVAAALAQLRAGPQTRLRPSPRLQRALRATVHDREVVLREHLLSPGVPRGIRHFGDVELPLLVDAAAHAPDVGALFGAYERARPGTDIRQLVGAVATLVAYDILEATEDENQQGT